MVKNVTIADIQYGCQPPISMLNGESRGSTQPHDTMIGDANMVSLGIDEAVDGLMGNQQADHGNNRK